jgi:hypothetical protein
VIMPAVWNADRRMSQAQADFWNPTGAGEERPPSCPTAGFHLARSHDQVSRRLQ